MTLGRDYYRILSGLRQARSSKSDDQEAAMDKAQTKAEDAEHLLEDKGPNEDHERFIHFVDPCADEPWIWTGSL